MQIDREEIIALGVGGGKNQNKTTSKRCSKIASARVVSGSVVMVQWINQKGTALCAAAFPPQSQLRHGGSGHRQTLAVRILSFHGLDVD